MRILGIIPAKGKSTRLPRKNILPLGGKPLLAWVGEAAQNSGVFSRLIVSTEDAEIASIARDHGLDVPFLRPTELAVDPAGVKDVALHALDMLENQREQYDVVGILMPTCPLVSGEDVREAWELFASHDHPVLFSLSEFDHPPQRALILGKDGMGYPMSKTDILKRTQELPRAGYPNGAIILAKVDWLRHEKDFHATPPLCHVMPRLRSLDIDTPEDYEFARVVFAGLQKMGYL